MQQSHSGASVSVPASAAAIAMAAPAYQLANLADREGLTSDEYAALNLHWEDEVRRERAFRQLLIEHVQRPLDLMPNVLWGEIVDYLRAPALPPALQAQREAKAQIEAQLGGLIEQQETLLPALQGAANAASDHLAFRLQARQKLVQRVAQLESEFGSVSVAPENSSAVAAAPAPASASASPADSSSSSSEAKQKPAKQPKQPKQPKQQPKAVAAAAPNRCLIPKWKQRTADTHQAHLTQLTQLQQQSPPALVSTLFLGDSMCERWLTTGVAQWAQLQVAIPGLFNAGVGGDTVQNLLWRTTPDGATAIDRREAGCSLLQQLGQHHRVERVLLFIGTNNSPERDTPEAIVAGITAVMQQLTATQPALREMLVYAVPPRSDVPPERMAAINARLSEAVAAAVADGTVPCARFSDDLARAITQPSQFDDHVHFNEAGYAAWFEILQRQLLAVDGTSSLNSNTPPSSSELAPSS